MATPLNGHPEWVASSVDGPGQTAAALRSVEKSTVLRFASATARSNAFTAAGVTPVAGMVSALDDSPGALWVHNGTGWDKLSKATAELASGSTSVVFDNSTGSSVVAVTFPSGRFSATPQVGTQVVSPSGQAVGVTLLVYSVSASGFSMIASASTARTITLPVSWQAMVTGLA